MYDDWLEYDRMNERARNDYERRSATPDDRRAIEARNLRKRNARRLASPRKKRAPGCLGVRDEHEFAHCCYCSSCRPARQAARNRGWDTRRVHASTLAEIDDAAVGRALSGERMHLRPIEKREVVRRAVNRGEDLHMIADRLGLSKRQVERHISRLRRDGHLL